MINNGDNSALRTAFCGVLEATVCIGRCFTGTILDVVGPSHIVNSSLNDAMEAPLAA